MVQTCPNKEERDKNSLSAFKRCIKKRDLTNVISDGGCINCQFAIIELITCTCIILVLFLAFKCFV